MDPFEASLEPPPPSLHPRAFFRRVPMASLLAGAIVLLSDALFEPRAGHLGPARIIRMAIADRFGAFPSLAVVVLLIHFGICTLYAMAETAIISRMTARWALLVGALYGTLLYVAHYYGLTPFMEWVSAGRDLLNLANHVAFGVIVAACVRAPPPPITLRRAG